MEQKKNEKKQKFDESLVGNSSKAKRKTSAPPATIAIFSEDGNEVEIEVQGQATDFQSENEEEGTETEGNATKDTEPSDSDSTNKLDYKDATILDDQDHSQQQENNNASKIVGPYLNRKEGGCHTSRFDEPSDVVIAEPMPSTLSGQESNMKNFMEYMKSQGLVIVEASKVNNRNVFNKSNTGMSSRLKKGRFVQTSKEIDGQSEVTVYKNAVPQMMPNNKRDSSSSEEPLDMSDEIDQLTVENLRMTPADKVQNFITENDCESQRQRDAREVQQQFLQSRAGMPVVNPDRQRNVIQEDILHATPQLSRAQQMVKDTEMAKARIYDVKGKEALNSILKNLNGLVNSVSLDEDYLVVGSHLDDSTCRKIMNGEYIDFARLIPKDKVASEEDHRMEIVNLLGPGVRQGKYLNFEF